MLQPIKFGKYLLLERVAVGGMAEVFVAKAFGVEGFERLLAIKKILPTMGEDQEFITMFVDEARIAVQLAHANIVQVLELGKHDDNLFIAMEYISGRDVRQLLERFRRRGEPMPIPQACTIVGKVCEALDYAHRKRDAHGIPLGIVHRDVSPQNVLVSFEGDVKLIDFGIAKAESRLQRTQAGILKGKFSYMSPEQVRGQPIDHRSDVFAVGVLLWELLCGEKLFTGDSDFAVLEKVRNGAVPAPRSKNPRIPEALERVVLKALAAEVNERYQWASELHDALVRFTLVGDIVYGARQLSEWIREEFHVEYEKEQARLRGWLGIADQDVEVTPSDPHRTRRSTSSSSPRSVPPQAMAAEVLPTGQVRPRQPPRPPEPEPLLVQPPTPTGVRGRPTASQRATPPPGELRVPVLPPQPPAPPQEDLSHELPTMKMDGDALIAAEKALAARRAAAEAAGRPFTFGEGEDESTVREAGAAKGDPALVPTMPEGYRVERADLPSARPPAPPPDITPLPAQRPRANGGALGPEEKTPQGGPPDLGPHDPTPAHPIAPPQRADGAARPKPVTLKERPVSVPPPAPAPTPPASPPAAGATAQPAKRPPSGKLNQPVDLVALANEQTQPLPIQPSAFDVSDDPTAAPRAQRKAGLTRPVREQPRFEAPKRGPRWSLIGAFAAAAAAVAAFMLWPASEVAQGKLVFTITPSVPADLILDGKPAGALPPFVRTLAAGPHKIEVRAGGFKPFVTNLEVAGAGRPVEAQVALVPDGPMQVEGVELNQPGEHGEVVPRQPSKPRWLSGPSGSTGSANPKEPKGEPAEKPEKGAAPEGAAQPPEPPPPAPTPAPTPPRQVEKAARPAALDPGSGRLAKIELEAPKLQIITTPPGAEVSIDDRPVGRTPVTAADLDTSKVLIVKISLDGYKPERRVAKAEDGKFAPLLIGLVPLPKPAPAMEPPPPAPAPPTPAAQQIAAIPVPALEPPAAPEPQEPVGYLITMTKPVAKVLVDGKDTGRWTPVAPKNPIALAPGPHTIVFETAQGRRHEEKVVIEVGKTSRVIKMDL